ncbi:MAG: transcriptional regulator MraZ [Actinomycetota bacterium]|jgi:MraZ protein|nr:transcriptional regulator MraZ [Actinomycetota bacterium]
MFFGEYKHSLDAKGRLILPAKFRDRLERGAYVTKVVDGCLAIWTEEEFAVRMEQMLEKARRGEAERNVMRAWAAGAAELTPDKQGRIALPAALREFAALDDDVMVIGAINHVELWNLARWQSVETAGSEGLSSGEGLADMGF